MMKKMPKEPANNQLSFAQKLLRLFERSGFPRLGFVPGIVCLCSFIAALLVVLSNNNPGRNGLGDLSDFEVGRVADRDIVAEYTLTYIDEHATRLRMEAQENLVPAIFRYSHSVVENSFRAWDGFCDFVDQLEEGNASLSSIDRKSVV